jgi:hypothetical protein
MAQTLMNFSCTKANHMKRTFCVFTIFASGLLAQDAKTPLTIGGFENQGSATFGYRFTDVQGYRPKYDELFNLQSGPRLLDFNLFGKAKEGENRFADDYSLTTSGLGGDPFPSTQFTVRKSRVYDLRANFRQSYYYWNRNDSAAFPNGLIGITNNHNWATVRKLGSLNLLVHATNNLKFSFEYYRNSRDGVTYTTRSPYYYGEPASFDAAARANPYYIIAPINEMSNRVTGGVDYTKSGWSLHYKLGYQVFDDAVLGDNVVSPQTSLNLSDPTASKEFINGMSWTDSRHLTTPTSEFAYTGKLASRWDLRGGYIFYRYAGPASLNYAFDGSFRSGTSLAPVAASLSGRADVSEPNNVVDQGVTFHVNDWWRVMADYRYSRFTVDSVGQFRSVTGTTLVATGTADNQWRLVSNTLDFNTVFTPMTSLLVRAGVRLYNNDVRMTEDGTIDPARTKHIRSIWPVASVHYEPSKMFRVKADIEQVTNDVSYTRITPHTDLGGRFIVRFRPTEKLYFEDAAVLRNRRLLETDYRSTIRSNAVTANYDLNDKFVIFAGFSYDDFYASNYVTFLRGTAPLTNTLKDQTVSRIWSGGIRTTPFKGFGVNFTGNFVRTTGMGEIGGEAPLYGPMSFPYATGSLYYDFPRAGRLTVQLQRTYYTEQIVPGNNFSANILTLAWTKGF